MNCRHCNNILENVFLDLGFAPLSNAYLKASDLQKPESYYPLKLYVCNHCWLVQTIDYANVDTIFRSDYAYFSSVSQSWLDHAAEYADKVSNRFKLNSQSYVIEVASNDGYLLRNFVKTRIPCLGIEPTISTSEAAEELGIPVLREFFGSKLAEKLSSDNQQADLVIGNNVYAHVPDINDFTLGLKTVLKPKGVITLEFPHLLRLIEGNQFDTVYHEHFSYLTLHTVSKIFEKADLKVWDIEHLPTHGGSLRIYGCHKNDPRQTTPAIENALEEEQRFGLRQLTTYQAFQSYADKVKIELLHFLVEQKRIGKKVAAYGAAAKGNTLLNYAGIKPDLLEYVCDAALSKQGKFLPGSHIPILKPEVLREKRPDFLLILPWNISKEVMAQNSFIAEWGGKFVTAIPKICVT